MFIKFIVRYLPFIIHLVLWKLRIFIEYVWRYRSKVILDNLNNSFKSKKSSYEIHQIKHNYYKILTRYIREVIFKTGWEKEKVIRSVCINDHTKWHTFFAEHKGVIVLVSHSGNWEYNLPILPALVRSRVIAFYKPISNAYMDRLMYRLRSSFGMENYPIEQTARVMAKLKDEQCMFLFVGDQSPLNMNGVHWNTFLNQDTPWLMGAEKLAIRYQLPVAYLEQIPEDGSNSLLYTIKFHLISQDASSSKTGEITQKYTEILSQEINQRPEYWLWSHRRWKRSHLKPTTS
ncbi:MAG: lysophospholipid acyltransferase family protein [Saprospiraceae bacterium]|nr:lysophospholipid acyltransferase family protein [Saprospiraceae bacterium]